MTVKPLICGTLVAVSSILAKFLIISYNSEKIFCLTNITFLLNFSFIIIIQILLNVFKFTLFMKALASESASKCVLVAFWSSTAICVLLIVHF